MTLLPRGSRELDEGSAHPIVKRRPRLLDPVMRATPGGAFEACPGGQVEQEREIRHKATSRERIGASNVFFGKSATGDLVRVCRKEKAIGEHELPARECRPDHVSHQLGTRRHEQQRLGPSVEVTRGIEQQGTGG